VRFSTAILGSPWGPLESLGQCLPMFALQECSRGSASNMHRPHCALDRHMVIASIRAALPSLQLLCVTSHV
jgi:hypothetical protein